jgi:hypothetical protein
LPAKLVLLGTNFSTLSSLDDSSRAQYSGTFFFRNLPAGTYNAAIQRPGSKTLMLSQITLREGEQTHFVAHLQDTSPAGNLVQNPDFTLHWISSTSPDHWRHEPACHCWLSDNIPVTLKSSYRLYVVPGQQSNREATMQWMAMHSQRTDDPSIRIPTTQNAADAAIVTLPSNAVYGRISIAGDDAPQDGLREVVMIPSSISNSSQ